jgi:hypothetical protein
MVVSQFDLSNVSHKATKTTKHLQSIEISLCALCLCGKNIETETLLNPEISQFQNQKVVSLPREKFQATTSP